MYKKIIWPLFLVLGIGLAVTFLIGFISAIGITSAPKEADSIERPKEDVAIKDEAVVEDGHYDVLVLGDSIGAGVGDDTGMGLGIRYANQLKESQGVEAVVTNRSVSGAVTSELAAYIDSRELDQVIEQAEVIIISIGGNDVNRLLNADDLSVLSDYEALLEAYSTQMNDIITRIQSLNKSAQIVLIGLYNPYGTSVGADKIRLLLDWNYENQLLIESYEHTMYVPTYDLFRFHLNSYLAIDEFHPNDEGYEAVVERIMRIQ